MKSTLPHCRQLLAAPMEPRAKGPGGQQGLGGGPEAQLPSHEWSADRTEVPRALPWPGTQLTRISAATALVSPLWARAAGDTFHPFPEAAGTDLGAWGALGLGGWRFRGCRLRPLPKASMQQKQFLSRWPSLRDRHPGRGILSWLAGHHSRVQEEGAAAHQTLGQHSTVKPNLTQRRRW